MKKQLDEIQAEQKELRKEVEAIRDLLSMRQNRPRPVPNTDVSFEGAAFQGDPAAKVTLIEFLDFQCPFCGLYFKQTLPQLLSDYVRTGKVKYIVRDFPLDMMHPQAFKAAEAARCAGDQGKYWPMHDQLMANPKALDRASLSHYAQAIGLDVASFDRCVDTDKYAEQIHRDVTDGAKAGVDGTPTFFLGITSQDGRTVKSAQILVGAVPFVQLKEAIDKLLAQQNEQK